jgi:hypothetical protein
MEINETTEARAINRNTALKAVRRYLKKAFFENRHNSEVLKTRVNPT